MIFFDNEYLAQYLDLGRDVKVTVNGDVLTLTDISDVEDANTGVGYDYNGNASEFQYTDIEQIQVGPNIITLDVLQKIIDDKEPAAEEKPASKPKPPAKEKPEKDIEQASFDPYMIGKLLIYESRKRYKRTV